MTIKKVRELAGFTQAQLAEKIGCTQKDVSRWETGIRRPKYGYLEKIATVCGIDVTSLLPSHGAKARKAMRLSYGAYPQTCDAIFDQICPWLVDTCTADQLSAIAKAIDTAYHSGKKSMGAEIIDGNFVWIDCLNAGCPLESIKKIIDKDSKR
jgi:transcriptional regulator with XRE-family HTH domain